MNDTTKSGNPFANPDFMAQLSAQRVPRPGRPPYRRLTDFSPAQQSAIQALIEAQQFSLLEHDGDLWVSWHDLEPYSLGDNDVEDQTPPWVYF